MWSILTPRCSVPISPKSEQKPRAEQADEAARPRAGNQQCPKHVQRFSLTGSQSGQLYRSRETEETSGERRFISRQPNSINHKCTAVFDVHSGLERIKVGTRA